MVDFSRESIGQGLQGIAAGLQGRSFEFGQAFEARQAEQSKARRQSLLIDNRVALDHVLNDRIDQANQVGANRVEAIQQLGGDPSDTLTIMTLIRQGKTAEAVELMRGVDREATISGEIPEMASLHPQKAKDRRFTGKIENDAAIFEEADGTITAQPIAGLAPKTPKQSREQVMISIANAKNEIKRLDSRADVNTGLRDEGVKLAKNFTDRRAFAGTINNVLKGQGGVSDLALGTAFFKIIDPGSTVTQNEFNQIRESRNLGAKGEGILQKIIDGEVLNVTERKAIANLAQNQLNSFKKIARDGLGRLVNVANNDKRFKSKFTAEEIYGDSIANVLAGGDIDPEKLGVPAAAPVADAIVPRSQPGATAIITSQAQFDALPSGATFIEDGVEYRKP